MNQDLSYIKIYIIIIIMYDYFEVVPPYYFSEDIEWNLIYACEIL